MVRIGVLVSLFVSFVMLSTAHAQSETIRLYAAGSLKAALGEVARAFEQATGNTVESEFGPSGLLRERIEKGEAVHVFASANMAHPLTLVEKGFGQPVALFARNNLCALAQAEVQVGPETLLGVMLDEQIRLGTSTPKADPSGDYAWELFAKADAVKAGSTAVLTGKALQLTGGPDSAKAPEGRNQYAWVMEEKKADLFLTYCTNGVLARKEVPALQLVQIPPSLSVGADYGLLVLRDAPVEAWRLALFILGPDGQRILAEYGFTVGGLSNQ
ncbi:molybdate ABC transporter substrate-binding protein [Desulfofustis limnaeus]|jgi:molybdenum ABC transporter molybdate-binding protein|uniref:ABC transporter substrate-binding protein n=1 Tax=Desulfofustis limnaeus TaxID=2740163 RepID=A0ABM7W909_9BACT|nr:molybdate ABC transporter substrate-binding protein [Desulfofustis limnaeus]MDX9894878.1 molybdate ABC transporter substrate-binding protein [Desulfofustis sp.]BDD87472.1 ABC transporter substrate-binding protein [Desulfofustis limnaeus]